MHGVTAAATLPQGSPHRPYNLPTTTAYSRATRCQFNRPAGLLEGRRHNAWFPAHPTRCPTPVAASPAFRNAGVPADMVFGKGNSSPENSPVVNFYRGGCRGTPFAFARAPTRKFSPTSCGDLEHPKTAFHLIQAQQSSHCAILSNLPFIFWFLLFNKPSSQ